MLRRVNDTLEWLVLADSVLLLDVVEAAEPVVACDDREAQFGAFQAVDSLRNCGWSS